MPTHHITLVRCAFVSVCATAILLTTAATSAGTAPADPGGWQDVSIASHVVFDEPPTGTFEATGPLCPSGTLTDRVVDRQQTGVFINRTFTCADGSGQFTLQFRLDYSDATSMWRAIGGDGRYANILGHGRGQGAATETEEDDVVSGVVRL